MKLSSLFGRVACALDYHKWATPEKVDMLRSKAGLLMGTVETGEQTCQRCSHMREAFRAGSLLHAYADDTGWKAVSPDVKQAIEVGYCKL